MNRLGGGVPEGSVSVIRRLRRKPSLPPSFEIEYAGSMWSASTADRVVRMSEGWPLAIDLFCGLGGWAEGADDALLKVIEADLGTALKSFDWAYVERALCAIESHLAQSEGEGEGHPATKP